MGQPHLSASFHPPRIGPAPYFCLTSVRALGNTLANSIAILSGILCLQARTINYQLNFIPNVCDAQLAPASKLTVVTPSRTWVSCPFGTCQNCQRGLSKLSMPPLINGSLASSCNVLLLCLPTSVMQTLHGCTCTKRRGSNN